MEWVLILAMGLALIAVLAVLLYRASRRGSVHDERQASRLHAEAENRKDSWSGA
jgi:hypothetical protein